MISRNIIKNIKNTIIGVILSFLLDKLVTPIWNKYTRFKTEKMIKNTLNFTILA